MPFIKDKQHLSLQVIDIPVCDGVIWNKDFLDTKQRKVVLTMKKFLVIVFILFLILLSAIGFYFYYPLYQVSSINHSINIAGIKLLMPVEEVNKMISGGEYIYGMGAYGYEYEKEKVKVFFSSDPDGLSYDKVSSIITQNQAHSVSGIRIKDSLDTAYAILEESGFWQETKNYFKKGDIYIILTPEHDKVKMLQIGFIDRRIANRIY